MLSVMIKIVSVESPYSSPDPAILAGNIAYAILATKNAARVYGEVPFTSHLLLTQTVTPDGLSTYVSDLVPDDLGVGRDKTIEMTHAVRMKCDAVVMYVDRGISRGMESGRQAALKAGIPVIERHLSADELARVAAAERARFPFPAAAMPVREE